VVYSTSKLDCHDMAEILLKVALNTINPNLYMYLVRITFSWIVKNLIIELNIFYLPKILAIGIGHKL
jgi:hypothetical protein